MTFATAVEEESKTPSAVVVAAASVVPRLLGSAVWRQERAEWWIRRPSGVWTPEDTEQVGADIVDELFKTRPGKL